jgi:diguanylate cyclase (GGDEF)-like protein/PAS domain S-box-containing protein
MKPSFKAKVIISVCSIVASVMAINAYIHVRAFQNEFFSAQTLRSKALVQGIIEEVSRLGATMSIEDMAGLLGRHCYQLRELNEKEGIAEVAVIARDGILVAHSDFAEPLGRTISSSAVRAALSTHEVITIKDEAIFHTLIPVGALEKKVSAVIDVGWKKASYDTAVHDILIFSLLMFLLSALVVSLIISLLLNKVFGQMEGVMNELRESKTFTQDILDIEKYRNYSLELIASDHPLAFVLENIALGVEKLHPQMLCSILLLDKSGEHLITGAAPSLPPAYNQAINGVKIGLGVGSCGTAAFTNQRVLVDDISTHPYWAPYKELAAQSGLGACWSQPINSAKGQVLGTFAIYHHQPNAPSGEDILLIEKTARLASIAIEKDAAAIAIHESEQRYRLLVDSAKEGIGVAQDAMLKFVNPALQGLIGYSAKEVLDLPFFNFIHPEDQALAKTNYQKRIRGEASEQRYQLRFLKKDGSIVWIEMSGVKIDWEGRPATLNFISDINERKLMQDQVQKLAFFDPLTNLPNRRLLDDRITQAMATSKRSNLYCALLFLDLDNFKPLNDTYGHDVGDLLLIEAANRLKGCIREVDTVARFGGDEFVVMLSELETDKTAATTQARVIAEKILSTLSAPYLLDVNSAGKQNEIVEHHCTASIGLTVFINHEGSREEILKRADNAMYQAKTAGRNSIRLY